MQLQCVALSRGVTLTACDKTHAAVWRIRLWTKTRRATHQRSWLLLTALATYACTLPMACGRGHGPAHTPAVDKLRSAPGPVVEPDKLSPNTVALFAPIPISQSASLLGKEVVQQGDGWVVAEHRRAGCIRLEMHSEPHRYQESASLGLDELVRQGDEAAPFGVDKASSHYRRRLALNVTNTSAMFAELQGDCGQHVIKGLLIGTGTRELLRNRAVSQDSGPRLQRQSLQEREGFLQWEEPQVWAVQVGVVRRERFLTSVRLSKYEVTEGERFALEVAANQPVYLVVTYHERSGQGGVLLPSASDLVPQVRPYRPLTLVLQASLRAPMRSAVERIHVYAFNNFADFDNFRPPLGVMTGAETQHYVDTLGARLRGPSERLPQSRWDHRSIGYRIYEAASDTPPGPAR